MSERDEQNLDPVLVDGRITTKATHNTHHTTSHTWRSVALLHARRHAPAQRGLPADLVDVGSVPVVHDQIPDGHPGGDLQKLQRGPADFFGEGRVRRRGEADFHPGVLVPRQFFPEGDHRTGVHRDLVPAGVRPGDTGLAGIPQRARHGLGGEGRHLVHFLIPETGVEVEDDQGGVVDPAPIAVAARRIRSRHRRRRLGFFRMQNDGVVSKGRGYRYRRCGEEKQPGDGNNKNSDGWCGMRNLRMDQTTC